tara:strand:- start:4772 stop:5158 length:387 start_codon:yes stop_codon:yes gene_type:complete
LALVAGLGVMHPDPADPWTIEAMGPMDPNTEYCERVTGLWATPLAGDWINCDMSGAAVECHAGHASSPTDEDGDTTSEFNDPSCIVLIDTNGNGICDSRGVQSVTGLEHYAHYRRVSDGLNPACTGWE